MASDILKLIIDADSSGAVREFQKLGAGIKSSVGDAEKATTGFKGAITKAFDGLQAKSATASGLFQKVGVSSEQAAGLISAAIPAAGVAAAAGLAAFAAKGVTAFQNVALAAGKFADSTGLSVDSASRYIAVADDIGVGASTIQSAFVKMEKAMGTNKAAFGDLIATTKSGGTDLDQTFLNAITHLQGIKDPIERATESSKLFGKGFSEVSQIIGTNADTLKAKLASVPSAQVINAAELQKARDYQAAMDNLKDSVRDLSISLGQELVPKLTSLANTAATAVNFLGGQGGGLSSAFHFIASTAEEVVNPLTKITDLLDRFKGGGVEGVGKVAGAFQALSGPLKAGAVDAGGFGTALLDAQHHATDFGGSADAIAQNLGHESDALKSVNDALSTHINLVLEAEGGQLAVSAATREFNKAVEDNTKVQADASATTDEKAAALDRETSAALATASATVDYAKKQEEAKGKTLDARDANKILIDTLYTLATKSSPEVQGALAGVITKLQETGQHPEPTVSVNDQATVPITGIKDGLDGIRGKTVTVTVDANTAAANAKLDALSRRLSLAASAGLLINSGGGGIVRFAQGGMVPGGQNQAVPAIVHGGEYVLPAHLVDAIKKGQPPGPGAMTSAVGGGSGTVVQITVNGAVDPYSTARQIQTILAKGARGGFSAKAA